MSQEQHRIELFQHKIGVAIAELERGDAVDAKQTLQSAIKWDEDIYQK